jgi:hypothetical protein
MKTYVITIILAALFIIPSFVSADTELFTRYLQKGDSGSDVTLLQKVLNSSPDTLVAESGDGSPGNETRLFGELTKQAVIKLQKKNNLGNKYGFFTLYSGALDDRTRGFLNGKIEDAHTATSTPGTAEQQKLNEIYRTTSTSYTAPFISSIAPGTVVNGDTVTITGRNFSTTTPNTIRMTHNSTATTSPNGTTLQVKVNSALQTMFNKEAEDLDDDAKDEVKKKIGEIPLFITVQNVNGISNPYQIFITIK